MSAIIVIRHSNAVYVLTDGAATMADGQMLGLNKVFQIPHLNAVLSLRGTVLLSMLIASNLQSAAATYDDLKNVALDQTRKAVDEAKPSLPPEVRNNPQFELVVAGFSETTGPDSFFVSNNTSAGFAPWVVHQLPEFCLLPGDPPVVAEFQRQYPNTYYAADIDPVRDGIAAMEIQRRFSVPDPSAMNYRPGKFVQLSVITRTEIRTRIVHRWQED